MNPLQNLSDAALVILYQETRDSKALGELYCRYSQKVFVYSQKLLQDREQALDLTQDIFLKIAKKIDQLTEPTTFVKWLFRIAHNDCIDILKRKKGRQSRNIEINEKMGLEEVDTDLDLEKEQQIEQLCKMMEVLPEDCKKILTGKYLENKSLALLMEEYGISESAVKMRLSRSRSKLKNLYYAISA